MNEEAESESDKYPYGAEGEKLRLWRAREAVRHGEARFGGQQNNIAAMESRAASILGWAVPLLLALGVLITGGKYYLTAAFGISALLRSVH